MSPVRETSAADMCGTQGRWPVTVQLEITDRCNMRCPMCITSSHCDKPREDVLSLDSIVREVLVPLKKRGVSTLSLSGGEPTISPQLIDVIREAKTLGYGLFLATNALTERFHSFDSIVESLSGVSSAIQVSFDSMYPEEMSVIRGGDYFEAVSTNLRKLIEKTQKAGGETRLVCVVVVQEANAYSFLNTIDHLLGMGIERVVVQLRHDYSEIDASNWMKQRPLELSEGARDAILRNAELLFERARQDQRIQVIGGLLGNWEAFLRNPTDMRVVCNAAKRVFVDPYGNLRGCIHSKIIGNLGDTNINDFLDSEIYADFVKFAKICNICIHGCAR